MTPQSALKETDDPGALSYLMESSKEGERLQVQERANPSSLRLLQAGLSEGQRVADLGCGSGAVMPTILELVGAKGSVTGIDISADRVAEARVIIAGRPNAEVKLAPIHATGLPDEHFDFTWSQFVFEYLTEPRRALDEMIRITRPGGVVAVADVDGLGLAFWPRPRVVEEGLALLMGALDSHGFDFFIGRKLFTLFREAGLREVSVHLSPLYVSAGANERLIADYVQRFEVLTPVAMKAFGDERRYREFADAYLDLLADSDALKYAVALTVAGRRER